MNTRAHDLVVIQHGTLGMFPGARAISFHTFSAWTYSLIFASTDAAVRTLGHDLGLGALEIRATRTAWWYRTMAETARGEVRVEVIGPHHAISPPAQ